MTLFSSVWKCVRVRQTVGAHFKNKLNNLKNCILNVYNNIIRHPRSSFDRIGKLSFDSMNSVTV